MHYFIFVYQGLLVAQSTTVEWTSKQILDLEKVDFIIDTVKDFMEYLTISY